MNILIVDDNKNNRMILSLLLEDYMDDHEGVIFNIEEAEDGAIAVEKCKNDSFDLILMDIMMPNMDGIEATKVIRKTDSKIMIVAISAVDDGDRKKEILSSGAEDYISKPVNSDIFVSRIANYITLVESRKHKSSNSAVINLFTQEVFSRHTTFILDSDDSLAEFWEFFLLNARVKSDYLSDVVRTIFAIVEKQISIKNNNLLYIEESDDKQYFTLVNIDVVPAQVIQLLLLKNGVKDGYILNDSKLSFELLKEKQYEDEEDTPEPIAISQASQEEVSLASAEISSPIAFTASKELKVLDYIDAEDLYDLEDYSGKLNSLLLVVGSGDVTAEEVDEIYAYLDRVGSILATYSEVYPISQALCTLASDMKSHKDVFIENSEALGPMCKAFSNDLSTWITQSFHTGAPSADFMNDTIVVNCQTIAGMLKMDEAPPADEDFDDIFDF
jgi:CheY-like chemotaxis protein